MLLALVLLLLVNDYRAEYDLLPLLPSARLTEAAGWMAQDMVSGNYFSHTDSLGGTPFTRMRDAGHGGSRRGEVLARGYSEPAAVLGAWRDSPGHNALLLDAEFFVVGIGNAASSWVIDFGGCRSCPRSYPYWRW